MSEFWMTIWFCETSVSCLSKESVLSVWLSSAFCPGIFYFFKLHDFDNNQKLDGLELMAALTDYHKDEGEKGQFKEGGETFLENEAETIVDELLLKHDKNEDGFIDFFEVMNRDAMSLMNELAQADVNAEQQQQSSMEQELQQQQQQQQSSLEQELQDQQQQHDGENQGETHDESDPNQEQQQVNQQGQENQDITQQGESSEQQQDQQQQPQEQQEPSSLEQEYEQKQGQEG